MTWARTGGLLSSLATCVAALLAAAPAAPSRAATQIDASVVVQRASRGSQIGVDVWVDKEEGGVYRQGEPMRVFFRTNADAFVLIYNIDTEGYIHLVYPYGPDDPDRVEAGLTYQVPSRHDPYDLVADGPTGVEYVVAIASPEPFRDLPWYLSGYQGEEDEYGREDDEDSGVIVGDPYVGMDRVIRRVVPRGLEEEVATDDTYFYIERKVEYPRYVCADCHSYSYGGWYDPYIDVCTVVDIRIDAAWARYRPWPLRAPIVARPRYFYMVRSTAPTRYRQWKDRWSSADGRTMLRTRFQVEGTDKFRSRREVYQRRMPPELQNLRRPRSGRVWRAPDEVLRRYRDDAARARDRRNGSTRQRQRDLREGGDARGRDLRRDDRRRDERSPEGARERGDWRQRNDDRRREWLERNERRRNEQRQEQQRQEQQREEQQRNEERQRDQRERPMRERRDEGSRQEQRRDERRRDEPRREELRRDDQRRESQARERREEARHDEGRVRENRETRSEQRDRGDRGRWTDRHDKPDRGDRGGNGRRR